MKLHCTKLYNVIMKYDVTKDIEFIKEALQISDEKFSLSCGLPRSTFSNWSKGKNISSKSALEKIYSFAYEQGLRINDLKQQMYLDMNNDDEIVLFHGAKQELVGELDIKYANKNNDFGAGIYLGENYYQSASYVCQYDESSVYVYSYKINENLKVVKYKVDLNWMLTIAYFRDRLRDYDNTKSINRIKEKLKEVDIVIAPIADNNMYQIIDDFINGLITDKQCLASLSATDLGKQYVFLNNKALKNIKPISHFYLCNLEKMDYQKLRKENASVGLQKVKYVTREFAGKGKYIEELLK